MIAWWLEIDRGGERTSLLVLAEDLRSMLRRFFWVMILWLCCRSSASSSYLDGCEN